MALARILYWNRMMIRARTSNIQYDTPLLYCNNNVIIMLFSNSTYVRIGLSSISVCVLCLASRHPLKLTQTQDSGRTDHQDEIYYSYLFNYSFTTYFESMIYRRIVLFSLFFRTRDTRFFFYFVIFMHDTIRTS